MKPVGETGRQSYRRQSFVVDGVFSDGSCSDTHEYSRPQSRDIGGTSPVIVVVSDYGVPGTGAVICATGLGKCEKRHTPLVIGYVSLLPYSQPLSPGTYTHVLPASLGTAVPKVCSIEMSIAQNCFIS